MTPSLPTLFARELRRRRVFRVAAGYVVIAWLGIQIVAEVLPYFGFSDRLVGFAITGFIFGFPVAMALAWAFDLTPAGIRRSTTDAAPPHARALRRSATGTLVILMLAATTLGMWAVGRVDPSADVPSAAPPPPSRVAVLYFDDHSPGRDAGHFADGLTEALIQRLGQVDGLDVISRNGVKSFRGEDVSLDSIVAKLGVGSVIEGTVAQADGRLRVTVQLTDAVRGSSLVGETLERPIGDLFTLQDELTEEVSALLSRRLGAEIRMREREARAGNVAAWQLVRRAEQLLTPLSDPTRGDTAQTQLLLARADSLLASAERLDPEWIEPTVLRGWARYLTAWTGESAKLEVVSSRADVRSGYQDGLGFAERALDRAPGDPGALELRGTLRFHLWDSAPPADSAGRQSLRDAAEQDLRNAVATDPKRALALTTLGFLLRRKGAFDEARAVMQQAYEADQFQMEAREVLYGLAQLSLDLGRYQEALEWAREGRRRFPTDPIFPTVALIITASVETVEHDPDEAWSLAREITALSPPGRRPFDEAKSHMMVAAVLALAGLPDSARAVADRAHEAGLPHDPAKRLAYYEAPARLFIGDRDEALALLGVYLEAFPNRKTYIANDWWFERLWQDPRFKELVR